MYRWFLCLKIRNRLQHAMNGNPPDPKRDHITTFVDSLAFNDIPKLTRALGAIVDGSTGAQLSLDYG